MSSAPFSVKVPAEEEKKENPIPIQWVIAVISSSILRRHGLFFHRPVLSSSSYLKSDVLMHRG